MTPEYLPLFVYGTLRENEPATDLISEHVLERSPAVARGRWMVTNAHFPGVRFDEAVDDVPGELVWLDRTTFEEVLLLVDRYEGVPHLFCREVIRVRSGDSEVEAYAYAWVGGTDERA